MNRRSTFTTGVLVGMLLVMVLSSLGFGKDGNEKAPKFYLTKRSVQLGDFYEGVDIDHTFIVNNPGSAELHILTVRPG